jgi:hypothetical protein
MLDKDRKEMAEHLSWVLTAAQAVIRDIVAVEQANATVKTLTRGKAFALLVSRTSLANKWLVDQAVEGSVADANETVFPDMRKAI